MRGPVELQRTEAPAIGSDTVVVVSEALLPLLCLREVPVLREARHELTQLERFLLEMALALGAVKAEELEEVVSLPRSVLAGGMSRLIAGGAVRLVGDEFQVVREVAADFLEQEVVIREIESTADFALFPRSDDLLMASTEKGGSWLRQVERLVQETNAPVPGDLCGEPRSAYLSRRLEEGGVAGRETDVRRVLTRETDPPLLESSASPDGDDDEARPAVCPAYHCRAEIRRGPSGEHAAHAVVHGATRRGRRKRSSKRDQHGERTEVEVDLTGAVGLVRSWRELADALDDPVTLSDAWREIGPPRTSYEGEPVARARKPAEWEFLLSGSAAHAIAEEGRALTEPVGLAIEGKEARVELLCRFAAADEDARALFARDTAAAMLLGSGASAGELDAACRECGAGLAAPTRQLSPESVRERIWQLGWYQLAYALREREDFPHD